MLGEEGGKASQLAVLPYTDDGRATGDRRSEQREDWTVLHRPLSDRCHDVTHVLSQLFPELLSREPKVAGRRHGKGEKTVPGHGIFALTKRYVSELQKV